MDFDRDFGVNQVFVEDMYERWRQNPAAVDETWQTYFAALQGEPAAPYGGQPAAGPSGNGAGNGNANGHAGSGFGYANGNGMQAAMAASAGFSIPPPQGAGALAPVAPLSQPPFFERRAADRTARELKELQDGVSKLIQAYRSRGHLFANIDPLGLRKPPSDELELRNFGLSEALLDKPFSTDLAGGQGTMSLRDIVAHVQKTYTRSIGVEFMHGEDPRIRRWLQERMEGTQNEALLSREERLRILARLTEAETLETFLHKKYVGKKRFSLEGGESLIPLLDWLIEEGGQRGVEEIVIGMAHRGRLNILANILGKRTGDIFAEFEDKNAQELLGRGDVKYHLGYSSDREVKGGKKVHLSLAFNPSHLEWVNTVVEGRVRAKQDRENRDPTRERVMPVLIHGDAAFAGQGLVAEALNLANLEGYKTGGTIHIVINNQVGFTTNPEDGRSTPYSTDVVRMLRIPVFHVNGDDPEAVVWTVQLAVDYRQTFQQDVVVDLVCYRKYGHNEGDEPSFTQPQMYEVIRHKPPPRAIYAQALVEQGEVTQNEADALVAQTSQRLEESLELTRKTGAPRTMSAMAGLWARYKGGPEAQSPDVPTAVPLEKLRTLVRAIGRVPEGFTPHEKIAKLLGDRRKLAEPGGEAIPFDWGMGEHLAYASLLDEGSPIRFSGQDSRRGTFSHRHAVLIDVKNGQRYTPLNGIRDGQAKIQIYDSPLSEAGVVGYEYGFSLDAPDWLVCWEAQFGDFVNAAQVVIDQFISSAEDKWLRLSGLVMLLPHGFEGAGPEHSSARLERFLSLCAEDNMQVCNVTTPAQFFHLLRRQMRRPWRKPLIVMTPKSLLRAKAAVSTLNDLATGTFQRVIPDAQVDAKKARKVLLCSGKVYFDLAAAKELKKAHDVGLVRVEQIYPLPEAELVSALALYKDGTEVVWVQEEPFNMGSWYFLQAQWPKALSRLKLSVVSRPASASPATGSEASHKYEQQVLLDQALA
jgi:2-oxoglutarate dehydrogenase E1 component